MCGSRHNPLIYVDKWRVCRLLVLSWIWFVLRFEFCGLSLCLYNMGISTEFTALLWFLIGIWSLILFVISIVCKKRKSNLMYVFIMFCSLVWSREKGNIWTLTCRPIPVLWHLHDVIIHCPLNRVIKILK